MKKWINYQQLRYFKTIAEAGSIIGAAKLLGLGQPTLSIQLKQLEETIGVILFDRFHKKLLLTNEGKLVLNYANQIFSLGDELISILDNQYELPKRHFQIGVLDTIPKHTTQRAIEIIQTISPCSISIIEGSGEQLSHELLVGELSLVITNYIPSPKKGVEIYHKKISQQQVVIVGTEKYINLKKNFPKNLNNLPFILPTHPNKLRTEIDNFFNGHKIKYDLIAETQDMSLQKLLAIHGSGLMIAPEIAIEEHLLSGELNIIGILENIEESFYLLFTEKSIKNSVIQNFITNFKL